MSKAYILWGASGTGKDTQAQLLVECLRSKNIQCPDYFSVGKQLRRAVEEGEKDDMIKHSLFLKNVKETVTTGELLPAFVPIWIWTQWLKEQAAPGVHYVLNGVARKPLEGGILAAALKYLGVETTYLIILQVSDEEIVQRLLRRGRKDDTKEGIERRIAWYKEESVRGTEVMKDAGMNIIEVNGEGTVEEVFERIKVTCDAV